MTPVFINKELNTSVLKDGFIFQMSASDTNILQAEDLIFTLTEIK